MEVNEFFDSDNAQIAYELRNENGSLLAEYSRYQPQGTPESYVRVKLQQIELHYFIEIIHLIQEQIIRNMVVVK